MIVGGVSARSVGFWACTALLGTILVPGCGGRQSPEQALKRGEKCIAAGDKKKAIAAFTEAIRIDPKCKRAYVCRGMAHNELGNHQKALADFSKAIQLDSRDSYPYEQRAIIYRHALHDEAKANADSEAAAAIREKRWEDLKTLRRKR